MTRLDHVRQMLNEFEATYPALAPLAVETVWHRRCTAQESRAFNRRSGWRKATGIYFFIDFCDAVDICAESPDERFSVIRRIGKAEFRFADRITDYGHRVSGEPGARLAWDWWDDDWQEWFRYSQIDVIRIGAASASTLETYLLGRIPTHYNDRDVPIGLKGNPIIYDAQSCPGSGAMCAN